MKRLIVWGMLLLIGALGMSSTCYADFEGVPSWAYEANDNVPGFVDKEGKPIPNIYIKEGMILVDVYGTWAQDAIVYCAKQGYLDGMLSRKYWFSPSSYLYKSELAILLGRKSSINYMQYKEDFFKDIKVSDVDWNNEYLSLMDKVAPYYVNWAGSEGILKGSSQGVLNNDSLTREQAATMIDRFVAKNTNLYDGLKIDGELSFKDKEQISSWAKESVERLSKIKLFNGDEKGFFNPQGNISRAEICQIMFNLAKNQNSNSL
ncbi:MAG: S-layer homology domain-containing protein [Aminipila sp.]